LREPAGALDLTKPLPVLTGLEGVWDRERDWKQCEKTFILAIRLKKNCTIVLLCVIDINKKPAIDWNLENNSLSLEISFKTGIFCSLKIVPKLVAETSLMLMCI
jgi:hypothetical protein